MRAAVIRALLVTMTAAQGQVAAIISRLRLASAGEPAAECRMR